MEINRKNFGFNRILNVKEIIENSCVFDMEQADIDADRIIKGEHLEEMEGMSVLAKYGEPNEGEKYCYLKAGERIGDDGKTKVISIDKIIIDECLIDKSLFAHIFTVFLQQEDNEYANRIIVGNRIDQCFHLNIAETASVIAKYLFELYTNYTSDHVLTYTTTQEDAAKDNR